MKHPIPDWPALVAEYQWEHRPNGDYFGHYVNRTWLHTYQVEHVANRLTWRLRIDGKRITDGDLTECLETAHEHMAASERTEA